MTATTKNPAKKPVKSTAKQVKTVKKTVKKPEIQPKTEQKPAENVDLSPFLYSISALSRKFKLDRATVVSRLEDAGIEPKSNRSNEKLYLLDEVEIILSRTELDAAKLDKLEVEAEIKRHDLAVKKGEYASVAEFTEIVQKIFGRLHKNLAVQMPSRISKRLHDANSSVELAQLLKTEIAKEFDALRSDFTKYL